MKKFAIIGFGCAGYHALSAIREAGSTAQIDIYSDTGLPPYNPMLTTYYVACRLPYDGMFPFGTLSEIAEQKHANIITNTRVSAVHAHAKTVVIEDGREIKYDKILVATGATAWIPDNFSNLKNAFCMRTVADAKKLRNAVCRRNYKSAVIVGASMVGIKVAELLHQKGCQVILADMAPHVFALAAYPEVSEMIEQRLADMGIGFAFGQAITGAEEHTDQKGETTGYTVGFADGSFIETDLLVLNIGTKTSTGILSSEEVLIERGIVTDEHMRTSVPDIYAAGDCCQSCNIQSGKTMIIGLWANAGIQGRVAGRNMAGVPDETDGNILHNITHFLDMDFIGLGDNRLTGEVSSYQSPDKGFYLQAVLRGGKPAGFNILDNYGVSGILKSHLTKVLRGQPSRFTPEQRGQLIRYGLEEHFIQKMEGKQ